MEDHLARIARIAKICEAKAVVVSSQMMPVFSLVRSRDRETKKSLGNAVRNTDLLSEESSMLASSNAANATSWKRFSGIVVCGTVR